MPFLYPLCVLFHYHLGLFAHREFPWSLRKLLGLRNHVIQHRRIRVEESLDLEVRTGAQRVLSRGLEFDFHSRLSHGAEPVWESVHVYYLRGEFGGAGAAALDYLQPLETSEFETAWDAPDGGGWPFARLCGDFNPAHFFSPWARWLGFERAFSHTQRIIADGLRRLPEAAGLANAQALRLDVAYKGPVYYGSQLRMRAAQRGEAWRFDLYGGDAAKPAMPGRVQISEEGPARSRA